MLPAYRKDAFLLTNGCTAAECCTVVPTARGREKIAELEEKQLYRDDLKQANLEAMEANLAAASSPVLSFIDEDSSGGSAALTNSTRRRLFRLRYNVVSSTCTSQSGTGGYDTGKIITTVSMCESAAATAGWSDTSATVINSDAPSLPKGCLFINQWMYCC